MEVGGTLFLSPSTYIRVLLITGIERHRSGVFNAGAGGSEVEEVRRLLMRIWQEDGGGRVLLLLLKVAVIMVMVVLMRMKGVSAQGQAEICLGCYCGGIWMGRRTLRKGRKRGRIWRGV
jgi:hypothetical protein